MVRCTVRSGLCTDSQTLRYYEHGTDHFFAQNGILSNFGDHILPSRRYNTVRCMVRCQAGIASVKMVSERPLRPNTSHFHLKHTPLMRWRHTMLPWTTLRLGWGCISSGEGPSSGLHGNSKSDIVNDPWIINSVLSWTIAKRQLEQLLQKEKNCLGRSWSQTAKLRATSYCTVTIVLYIRDRTSHFHRLRAARYCVIQYSTVITA